MATKHPYTGVTGSITQVIGQLRKQFPASVDASTLKKYNIAPNNESYLINILKYIGILDDAGQKTEAGKAVFLAHDDEKFASGLAELVKSSYSGLFDLYGDNAWDEPIDRLISFFRQTDETSDVIGTRQARTFAALGIAAGKRDGNAPIPKKPTSATKATSIKAAVTKKPGKPVEKEKTKNPPSNTKGSEDVGNGLAALTVRIEVNLPAGADQETYDAIFKSIRANLMR